jgi:O-6-methylguanine DNA methyltransferase
MNTASSGRATDAEDRLVANGLATLRRPAPAGLAEAVLDRLGLGDAYVRVEGPIGPLFVAFGARGIALVERAGEDGDAGAFEEAFRATFGRSVRRVERAPELIARVIDARVWGRADRPVKVPLDLAQLPEFERSVLMKTLEIPRGLMKTLEIPRGEVRPYAWVAAEIGKPLAVRAVGNALARNPIPFVIPCHRVVRSDGRIGNYGAGGPTAKRAVLASEGVDVDELEQLPNAGVRFIGSDTTHIYCYPSCRNARRIGAAHRVALRTGDEARSAGYRACKVCRPVDAPFRTAVA